MRRKAKPGPPRVGLAEKTENRGWFFLSSLRRQVNLSGLFFHLVPVNGLGLAGGWCDLLTLWCPLLDMAARALRDAIGGRI